ncbi:hypothetical protein [Belliella marina]|uniref:hypothetical protein n=1 Tax=Belliella marina TaxID=1644146 RepID=UPI00366B72AE
MPALGGFSDIQLISMMDIPEQQVRGSYRNSYFRVSPEIRDRLCSGISMMHLYKKLILGLGLARTDTKTDYPTTKYELLQ